MVFSFSGSESIASSAAMGSGAARPWLSPSPDGRHLLVSHTKRSDDLQAIELYRESFQPSRYLDKPHFMLAANVFAADSDEEAAYIRTSAQQGFANLRSGRPGLLPKPVDPAELDIPPALLALVNEAQAVSATGSPETVKAQLHGLIKRYQPDEIILAGQIHDQTARKRSFEIAAAALA